MEGFSPAENRRREILQKSLPLWGRWHGEAVTEEVVPFRPKRVVSRQKYRTSPASFGGTLPKGEGMSALGNIKKSRGSLRGSGGRRSYSLILMLLPNTFLAPELLIWLWPPMMKPLITPF